MNENLRNENLKLLVIYNLVAFLSIVIPVLITVFVPVIGAPLGLITFLILWFGPGCNFGCIHVFFGGWMPFVFSYPLGLLWTLDEEIERGKEAT